MEIFLNFAWAVLAITLVTLWVRSGGGSQDNRRRQIVAIAMLIAILFPVISVSDDLMAMQNPTETDSSNGPRRGSLLPLSPHNLLPVVAAMPLSFFTGVAFSFLRYVAPGGLPEPATDSPFLSFIQNRPPPAA